MLRELCRQALGSEPGCVVSPALAAWMQSRRGNGVKSRNAGQVVLEELLSDPHLSQPTPAPKPYFLVKVGTQTQTSPQTFLFSCLNWTFLFFLSFCLAADYDVHPLLSAWLSLASNHRPALHCHFSFFLFLRRASFSPPSTVVCFLLFVTQLPADS